MIFVGADHRGLALKATINTWLAGRGYVFEDVGSFEYDREDDYVDVAIAVAQKVAKFSGRGILVCGSGVGVDIAANKVEGVRCGLGFNLAQVIAARKEDNVNVLALAADFIEGRQAILWVERFLITAFDQTERYLRRIEKMERYESA